MHDLSARGELDRRRAVVGGELVPVGKSAHVAGVANDRAGEDGPHAEQLGQRRPRGLHGLADPAVRRLDGGIDAA